MLATVNGLDLVLAVLAAAGWTAFAIERAPHRPRRVKLERRVYDWQRDGL